MEITAFFPNPPNGENFVDILARSLSSKEGEFTIVNVNYQRPGYNDEPADCKGLDVALTLDPEKAPIILCSFLPEKYLVSNDEFSHKFYALMAKKRIGFLDLSEGFSPDIWLNKYHELLEDKKVEDSLAIEINKIKTFEEGMGHIQHRVQSYFEKDSALAKDQISKAVEEAKKLVRLGAKKKLLYK